MANIMKFSRDYRKEDTVIQIKNAKIGGGFFAVAAGPCALESKDQYYDIAREVIKAGANIIRGSIYKPRTSPYSFQGLGKAGLKIIKELGDEFQVPTITEIVDPREVKETSQYADILQIGARNMQNFELLKEVAKIQNPIILKRGISATIDEWLLSAEYLMMEGKENIILCERGIRTFEPLTRNTLDLSIIPLLKRMTHLPVIVDPSHATGNRDLIIPVSKAAIASNADGLLIEVHNNPLDAKSDGEQSILPKNFAELMVQICPLLEIEKKIISPTIMDLEEIRRRIDYLDEEIIGLIQRRMYLIPPLVEYKKNHNIPAYQPEREKLILEKYNNLAEKYQLNPILIDQIFNLIIEETKQNQEKKIKLKK